MFLCHSACTKLALGVQDEQVALQLRALRELTPLIPLCVRSVRELQRELIMLACSFGNKQCHRQAVTYISNWISSNKNRYVHIHTCKHTPADRHLCCAEFDFLKIWIIFSLLTWRGRDLIVVLLPATRGPHQCLSLMAFLITQKD